MAAIIALPLGTIGMVAIAACADVTQPTGGENDEWAEAVSARMQVELESRVLRDDAPMTLPTISRQEDVLVSRFGGSGDGSTRALFSGSRSIARVQHYRRPDGRVMSIAAVQEARGMPPRRLYFFEDGKILMVASPKYQRHGSGWIRTAMRTTLFDRSGAPVLQSDWRGTKVGPSTVTAHHGDHASMAAVSDATTAAKPLLPSAASFTEDEEDAGKCEKERDAFKARTTAAALASTVYLGAMYQCFTGDPAACESIISLSSGLVVAAQMAVDAWQKWQDCLTQPPTPPTLIADDDDSGQLEPDFEPPTLITVEDFIQRAEENGTYYCTEGGNRCVYFATT